MAPTLIVVGDVMLDVSVAADRLVTGGDVHGDVRVSPGGSGANAAAWAAAGARVRLFHGWGKRRGEHRVAAGERRSGGGGRGGRSERANVTRPAWRPGVSSPDQT
ncbi:MAG: hypothetical protein H0W94_07145 [Actinobacteria bacterium]|nr:hypothetical protein [Actinomycetota bacterium]